MKKLLAAIVAGMFAVTAVPVAFGMKHEMKKEMKKDEKKAARAAVAKACKGKKPGEEVTVDGKKVKCPAPKKVQKKTEK